MLEPGAIMTLELGRYSLREPLASSAYGVVWRATAAHGGSDVALKLINQPQMARAEPSLRRCWLSSAENEIAFLSSLQAWDERHIVRLLDRGQHDGLPVMALELHDCDLGRHVARHRNTGEPLAFGLVLDWIGQVNQALAKVHQYGWRYLDLKPANLLLDARRRHLKLADFGTSRLLADIKGHAFAGTPNWQAPEQFFPAVQGGYLSDLRSDYFALGAMFYYLVTGGLPLRFCSECGHAFRDHGHGGAQVLRQRYLGAIPPTLRDDEAALFAHRIEQQHEQDMRREPHKPLNFRATSSAALNLLRALLHADPALRPGHALQISRMLADIRSSLSDPPAIAFPARRSPPPQRQWGAA